MIRKILVPFCLSICLTMSYTLPSYALTPSDFSDYKPNMWYRNAINYAVSNNIIYGTDAGKLEPNRSITRAEFVTMVNRLFGTYNKADVTNFKDINPSDWYYNQIAMSVQMGIISGTSNNTVDPGGNITREQAMMILAKVLSLDTRSKKDLRTFVDVNDISDWAIPYVSAFYNDGRVSGYSDSTIRPKAYITRAEAAQLLYNCFKNSSKASYIHDEEHNDIFLLRNSGDASIENSKFNGTLILAPSIGDNEVNIKRTNIGRLLCWGSCDIYFDKDSMVKDIVICRTDGPITIHWLGDIDGKTPRVIIRDTASKGFKVVDKDDNVIEIDKNGNFVVPIKDESNYDGGNKNTSQGYGRVYFDANGGNGSTYQNIKSDGTVDNVIDPTRTGYVFGGWYRDKSFERRFMFDYTVADGTKVYARWFTPDEGEVVEDLNSTVDNTYISIEVPSTLITNHSASKITCNTTNKSDVPIDVKLTLKGTSEVIAEARNVAPNTIVSEFNVVGNIPVNGYYDAEFRVSSVNGPTNFITDVSIIVI